MSNNRHKNKDDEDDDEYNNKNYKNKNIFSVLKENSEESEEETEPDYFKIGLKNDDAGNYEEAIYNYKRAIVKNKCSKSMFNLALILEKRDVSEAINYYKMAMIKGDKDAAGNISLLYLDNNDIENAEKYFKIAIKDNDKYIFLYHYANSTYNRGLVEESKELFELYLKSKNINKQDKELFKNLYIVNNKLFV